MQRASGAYLEVVRRALHAGHAHALPVHAAQRRVLRPHKLAGVDDVPRAAVVLGERQPREAERLLDRCGQRRSLQELRNPAEIPRLATVGCNVWARRSQPRGEGRGACLQGLEDLGVGAPPGEDRLVDVAHDGEPARVRLLVGGEAKHELELDVVRVLELVEQEVAALEDWRLRAALQEGVERLARHLRDVVHVLLAQERHEALHLRRRLLEGLERAAVLHLERFHELFVVAVARVAQLRTAGRVESEIARACTGAGG